ncbi:MAG: polysaccharide deacetylase family protein [Anaerolineaceae bacterium]|jgi:peptidoglycan/xylan/chitin deacetylase (PgdA/CDA1 family)|nr:polysaccharide deacetylase family protein [Anaerolineaceae bacterium]
MKNRIIFVLFIVMLLLTSCEGDALRSLGLSPSLTPTRTSTATPAPTQTSTATVTPTVTLTPTITPTPWALESLNSALLYPGVEPVQYIQDTCQYLAGRWGEGKAEPGTIVVPIMFHSILPAGKEPKKAEEITIAYFEYFMDYAQKLGFETVTTSELVNFLEHNASIPKYSMILILDDRRPDTPALFMPYLEANDWTLTLAWPTTDATPDSIWEKIKGYVDTGYVEVQPHGHNHAYIQSYTSSDVIEEEIYRPIEVIQDHFGTPSQAFIWPGGNFTPQSVEIASEAGYQIGFTVYSRGPLLYNWIPLGEPEREVGNPLMVLPRYWSYGADYALDNALAFSAAAEEQAQSVRDQELLYYSLFCQPSEGE